MGTKQGKKLADQLMEEAETYEEELEEKVTKLQKKGEELLEEARDVKEKIVKEVVGGKKEVTDHLVTKMDEALTKLEEVHHHYFKKNGKKLAS